MGGVGRELDGRVERGEGRLRSWAPGTTGPLGGMELEGEMRDLLEAVAGAGSWAVWMGVFDRGWMRLLEGFSRRYSIAAIIAAAKNWP